MNIAQRLSKGRASRTLEPSEEEKRAKRKAMQELELRNLNREAKKIKDIQLMNTGKEPLINVKKILSKEKNNLEDNLKLIKSTRQCILDAKQAQDITNLFAQGDDLDAAIAQEKKYIEDLDSQIRKDSQSVYGLTKEKGDVVAGSSCMLKMENERADRSLESWNSKLAASQKQLALAIKNNEEMRRKLENLLNEKARFNKIFEELMGKLTKGKNIMMDVVEQSRQEFQKRDEVSRKIDALKKRDKADLVKRMEEMQELEMKLYEDKRLAAFRHRVQLMREKLEEEMDQSVETIEQEKLLVRLEQANDFWHKLKEITGLSKAEEICHNIKREDADLFSLFNFNNEVRDQLEVITHKTADLVRTLEDELYLAERTNDDMNRGNKLIESKLSQLEQDHSDMSDHCGANARLLTRLLDKTKTLFDMVKCNTSLLQDLLGNNLEVTEFNYRLYLSLIETEVIDSLRLLVPTAVVSAHSSSYYNSSLPARPLKLQKSKSNTKSIVSVVVSKVVVTKGCWECEPIARRRFN